LSGPLGAITQQTQPQVVQVWFLSNTSAPPNGTPIAVVHGTTKLDPSGISWAATEPPATLRTMFGNGGQVLLRVHCGHMFDANDRPVSAALNAVTPIPNRIPVYGGIFETWFFVAPG
jgi:hypothetical protein